MGELIDIANVGSIGLITDIEPISLPLHAISAGNNFKCKNGFIEPVPTAETITTPTGFNAGYLLGIITASDMFILAAGRSAIKVYDGTSWSDISSVAGYAGLSADDELLWSGCVLGSIPILNNFNSVPEYWSPQLVTQVMQPLQFDASNTWLAKNYSAKVIRSHGQYLFALNLREGATYLPDSYRWSHPADVNGLPFTWDETDLSAVAGKASIGGNSGAIVDGLSLRDAFIIYSENAIHALTLSGDEFIWRRTSITYEYGLAAKDAIVELGGTHYFISKNDICINDGSVVHSLIYGKIKSSFIDSTNFQYVSRSFAFHHSTANEIWFCIPSNGGTYPNLAYVYNYIDGTFATRDLPAGMSFATYAIKLAAQKLWSTATATWVTTSDKWSSSPYAESMPLGIINADSSLVSLDDPNTTTFLPITLERTDLNITNSKNAETISKIFTNFNGVSTLNLRIGSQDFNSAPVRWQNAEQYDISIRRSLEQCTTGVLHAYSIAGTPTNRFRFNGISIEYINNGER